MPRIAIVTPWFGPFANGGAESLARELASRLAFEHDVTVLTTTARDFLSSWDRDHYVPGCEQSDGYSIVRFALAPRDAERFDALNARLLGYPIERRSELEYDDATDAFVEDSINSPALEEHLRDAQDAYDAVLFLPYLYGVVVRGIEAYPGKAHLLPCLHDEAYARIPRIRGAIHRAASLLFNSEGEAELALRLYGPGVLRKGVVIGSGVDEPAAAVGTLPVRPGFALCLGRRDETKNVDMLVRAYESYRRASSAPLALVLAGPGTRSYSSVDGSIVDLGFVDDATKAALLAGARVLLQPSKNESYSRVIMEAWRRRVPVVAHAGCLATSMAVEEAGGGWLARDETEWARALQRVEQSSDEELAAVAERGAAYAAERSSWEGVVRALQTVLGFDAPQVRPHCRRIDQVLETLDFGDAISEYAISIRDRLRALGHESSIYAQGIGPLVVDRARRLEPAALSAAGALIYHHSIRSSALDRVLEVDMPKALVYHNITPSGFFRPYGDAYADLLDEGRSQLTGLPANFDVLVADSAFNALEIGTPESVAEVLVIPPLNDFARFDVVPDRAVLARPRRGARWLFVGRLAPSKGIRLLIEAFEAFLAVDPHATLNVVGKYVAGDPYVEELQDGLAYRSLARSVAFTGVVDDAALHAYYRTADVFVTMSEHEGFCVPLVEAMMFDVPIVALATTAVPETLGAAGILVEPPGDPFEIACVVRALLADAGLRTAVIDAQRRRRRGYYPSVQNERIGELAMRLGS